MAIYERFKTEADDPQNPDVVAGIRDILSSGMWSGGSGTLNSFFTSSTQSGSTGAYYYDVYKTNPQTDSTAEVQFSVAYGHVEGSGSIGGRGVVGNRATAAIYSQFSNILLGPGEDKFKFGGDVVPNDSYFITLQRARLREKMDPGNWELHLSGSIMGLKGAEGVIKLIDDSGATTNPKVNQGGRVFNIVSGSIAGGTATIKSSAATQTGGGYGLFYPDLGIIILNGPVLNTSASLQAQSGSNAEAGNVGRFYNAIRRGNKFQARREEVVTSQHFFVRAPNQEFNFSSNPTFATASDGSFTIGSYYKNPKTFITQVGLYNDANELLAVAKLSKPLLKSFSREALIKVKLDF